MFLDIFFHGFVATSLEGQVYVGIAAAISAELWRIWGKHRPKVIVVEPEAADDAVRSFRSGRIERVQNPQTIADGTRTESLGEMTFAVIRKTVDDIVSVPEEAIIEATRLLFEAARVVVEPSGALGLAALLTGAARAQGRVGLILSGGNIDAPMMARILHSGR